jgi:two-component system, sensor histidine kinase ChiS
VIELKTAHNQPRVPRRWLVDGSFRIPALLIVDDFPPMLKILRAHLGEIALTDVDAATSAAQALSMLERRDYDLLIVDFYLGDRTGHDLVQALAGNHVHGETPSIIITGEPDRAARDLGFQVDWLKKPFTAQELRHRIESTCPTWSLAV